MKEVSLNERVNTFIDSKFRTGEHGDLNEFGKNYISREYLHEALAEFYLQIANLNPTLKVLKVGNLEILTDRPEVILGDKKLKFTPKEMQVITLLFSNVNRCINKADLINAVWRGQVVMVNNLDTHMSNIRRKLKDFSGEIKTVNRYGYMVKI